MKIAILYGAKCLTFRGGFDFADIWTDPKGLTGSELGLVKIARGLAGLGHDVTIIAPGSTGELDGIPLMPSAKGWAGDVALAINEPDLLRGVEAKLRCCDYWLNEFTHVKLGFHEHVDQFYCPSRPHLKMVQDCWRDVEALPGGAFAGQYDASQEPELGKWRANELGADPGDYDESIPKVQGRVVYISSPDRGLHRLLEQWPRIKAAVPHAHLKVFYRLEPWLRAFDDTPWFPPVEQVRNRALYVEECLRRIDQGPGREALGIEICDSVSREQLAREMREAEVLAYPCETVSWSEGFSCSTAEGCTAGCAVVVTDCDALGDVYRVLDPTPVGQWDQWRERVVRALTDSEFRNDLVARGTELAKTLTWSAHVDRLLTAWAEVGAK